METLHRIPDLRRRRAAWRTAGERLALVPTMGNLHAGHLALVERARALADRVVVSIFVNPLQFGPGEDFETYPRTLEADLAALAPLGVDLVFAPPEAEIYPEGRAATTRVEVPGLSDRFCGRHRPGFFVGVATVVAKLFNLVEPEWALFGEKDYQQLLVIRKMVRDLDWPIRIEGVPTVREPDGLALSSRNAYLTPAERRCAPGLYRTLQWVAQRVRQDRALPRPELEAAAMERLRDQGFRPDYVAIRRRGDLEYAQPEDRELIVLAAAWLGSRARLIDNLPFDLAPES